MSRAPRVSGPDLITALAKAGFRVLRVKGPGLLHKILRDCQLTVEQLADLL